VCLPAAPRDVPDADTLHTVDLDAYVAEHAGEWRRLEVLSRSRKLGPDEADELVALYQRAATHLSVVRSRSPDPALVARLSHLVLSARGALTGVGAFSWRSVGRFFTAAFPLAVYRSWRWWCGVATAFSVVSFGLMAYIAANPKVAELFLTPDEIDNLVNHDFASYYSAYQPQNFAYEVWTNNAFLSAQCLASGVLILPVFYLLFTNAFNVGLAGGVMIANGRGGEFFGLIMPHGLLELTSVFVAAGFGLRIGWAWIAPGPLRTRGRALAETAREGMVVALGLVVVLAVSGCLEAFVTPAPLPAVVRVGIGVLVWLGFFAYVVFFGRQAAEDGMIADLDVELGGASVPTA
jgi:uncharacterized membrane protein SpoIIM required for sporulation